MIRRMLLIAPLTMLAGSGCASNLSQIGKEPPLTPVGSGVTHPNVPVRADPTPRPTYRRGNSLWQDASADLFRDPRAARVGDLVTVKIVIKDKAKLDNNSKRSRKSDASLDASFAYDISAAATKQHLLAKGSGSFTPEVKAETSTDGKGEIERSESINLLVAAVVTDVLPNGNLVIGGTQEVRVNFEMRLLSVAGIVRPRDIATDNTVSYDRIAEARISYGGNGRITEVQQPGWGQQLIDTIAPY
jgi:flagellar L-ring protein precursor FlgH